jgi:hypothetical protein
MRGERVRYTRPLQLFLILNVAFFLVASCTGARVFDTPLWAHMNALPHAPLATRMVEARLAARGITLAQYRIAFNTASTTQAKSLVILMVPMFAAFVWLVNVRRRRFALQHLVFSLHAYSALFIILIVVGGAVESALAVWARWRGAAPAWQTTDQAMSVALVLSFGSYLALALRRAYGDRRAAAALKAVGLCAGLAVVLFAYRFVLFFTTFWTT